MDYRRQSYDIERIAKELIENEIELQYIKDSKVKICYLISESKKGSKGKSILGQCEKVTDKYKWAIPYDFTITLFEPNLEGMSEEQIRIVIFHELLHIGIEVHGDGSETYTTEPHDLEDFKLIIDKFGTDWAKTEKEPLPFEEEDD